ncbi:rhomboid family intramembrane serine protease [Evansella sp. AB-P1]|uniref:rhomboid family intramembrane serine protease n=1 Tax=Evansella sp. AB-P1 TaxID=3037653 RepID=UPI00241FB000|nr:rhomboid family intramembrane serine protease [Evansella sp. AB-P1]MDG5787948.1 rhomboid family intramembrane serine protease [Evansella sp. AB-P1]
MFIRNESFGQFIRAYHVVTALIIIHIILYLWIYMFPYLGGREIRFYGIGSNFHIYMGEYWRLVTPIFLHGSLAHMLFNSFSLFLFGPALEQMLGKVKFIFVYFFTGIIANIATYLLDDLYTFHLGASGAIYGLFGIYLYMVLARKDLIDQTNSQLIMTILIIGIIMTFVGTNINVLAHLFGLIAGAAIAPVALRKVSRYGNFRNVHDTEEIGFDPNRWQKSARNKKRLKTIFIVAGVVLVLLFIIQFFI